MTVTKNTRRAGHLNDLATATVQLAYQAGFAYLQHILALHAAVRHGGLVARPSFWQLTQTRKARARGEPAHLVVHEDVLVFTKPANHLGFRWLSPPIAISRRQMTRSHTRHCRSRCGRPPSSPPARNGPAGTCPPPPRTRPRCCPPSPATPSPPTATPAIWSWTRCVASVPPWSRPSISAATPSVSNWNRAGRSWPAPTSPTPATTAPTGTATVVTGDARHLPSLLDAELAGRVALVLTSPPYGASIHGQVTARPGQGVAKYDNTYSPDPGNLGRVNQATLLDALGGIFAGCHQLLRPGGLLVLTARPYRNRERLVDLPSQLTRVAEAAGLVLFERNAALLVGLREDRLVPRPSFFQLDRVRKARAHGLPLRIIAHEDVLVVPPAH